MLAVPSTRCAHVRFGLLRGLSVPIRDEAQGWGPPFPLVVRVTVSCDVCPALARSEEFTHGRADRTCYEGWAARTDGTARPFIQHWTQRLSAAAVMGDARRALNALRACAVRFA